MISYGGLARLRHTNPNWAYEALLAGSPFSNQGLRNEMKGTQRISHAVRAAAYDASLWDFACEVIATEMDAAFALTIGADAAGICIFSSDTAPHKQSAGSTRKGMSIYKALEHDMHRLLRDEKRSDARIWTKTGAVEALFGLPASGCGILLICDCVSACSLCFYLHLRKPFDSLEESEMQKLRELAYVLCEAATAAFKIRMLMLSEVAAFAEILSLPQAFVDANTGLLFANTCLSGLIGPLFTVADGCLTLAADANRGSKSLRGGVERCFATGSEQLLAARTDKQTYVVKIAPLAVSSRLLLAKSVISVTALQLGRSVPTQSQYLIELYGLTHREAEVARWIGAGRSVHEIAELHRVSDGTVRGQLKSIFRKVEARSQVDLAVKIRF